MPCILKNGRKETENDKYQMGITEFLSLRTQVHVPRHIHYLYLLKGEWI